MEVAQQFATTAVRNGFVRKVSVKEGEERKGGLLVCVADMAAGQEGGRAGCLVATGSCAPCVQWTASEQIQSMYVVTQPVHMHSRCRSMTANVQRTSVQRTGQSCS